ncbi:MAG: tetratricopeptide repeat protein [Armatimonas sp.]
MTALGGVEAALLPIERALRESRALLVFDNLESLLLPPYIKADPALQADAREALGKVLTLCQRLMNIGATRLVFTSREALPEPFAAPYLRLTRLAKPDAVRFVERVLQSGPVSVDPGSDLARARREEIEELVDAVQGHARTLSLLAPHLRSLGVVKTRELLIPLMEQMQQEFPKSREKSLFASVALSLKRLSPENQDRVKALAPFHGGAHPEVLRLMMGWEHKEERSLAGDLQETGLATVGAYAFLHLNPALCPYLRAGLEAAELEVLAARWQAAMLSYVEFLYQQSSQDAQLAATLTLLELPGLVALLEQVETNGDPTATIDLATSLHGMVRDLGKPRVMARISQARDRAEKALGSETWSHAAFTAQSSRIQQQLRAAQLQEAFTGATRLLERAQQAGEQAYPDADYDLAMAHAVLGRILKHGSRPQEALTYLREAEQRFEEVERRRPGSEAANMASTCLYEQADCLTALGRLDQAATLYETAIERNKLLGDARSVAVGSGRLGSVRLRQRRFTEALQAYQEALQTFTDLEESGSVAISWELIGTVHMEARNALASEDAYVKSLTIRTQEGDIAGQALTLNQLGLLYQQTDRLEGAIPFFRQAADRYIKLGDSAKEGGTRNNLASALRLLGLHRGKRGSLQSPGMREILWPCRPAVDNLEHSSPNRES